MTEGADVPNDRNIGDLIWKTILVIVLIAAAVAIVAFGSSGP